MERTGQFADAATRDPQAAARMASQGGDLAVSVPTSGIAFAQLCRPGSPMIYGQFIAAVSMRSGAPEAFASRRRSCQTRSRLRAASRKRRREPRWGNMRRSILQYPVAHRMAASLPMRPALEQQAALLGLQLGR